MDSLNKNAVVLERVGKGRIMLEVINKWKRNWLDRWLRRNCLLKDILEGMLNGNKSSRQKTISEDRQHYGKWIVCRYEKEGLEEGRMETTEFAVKDLPLGRTPKPTRSLFRIAGLLV